MKHNGAEIATCTCGRKYYIYSMTVIDQSLCPICREEEIEAAEDTQKEMVKRAIKRSVPGEAIETDLPPPEKDLSRKHWYT